MWHQTKTVLFRIILVFLLTITMCAIIGIGVLRWINPPTSAIMLQNNFREIKVGSGQFAKYHWIDWDEISKHVAVAAIAAEDQRFLSHHGIDFNELSNALSSNATQKRGASTITQQVAKNLFLWQSRSYLRKALEVGLTLLIEMMWSKQRILEVYLNIAQMGNNIYGISAASSYYYDKPPGQLNRTEAAYIVAILPNPSKYSVLRPSAFVIQRHRWILGQMRQLGGPNLLQQL